MTRILAVGYAEGPFLPDQPPPHAFPDVLERGDLERLTDIVAEGLEDQGAVLAIHPAWAREPSLRRLRTVRAALESGRVLTYASPLPPLAGSVLCAVVAAIAPQVAEPAVLAAGLPALERLLLPFARLSRVSGLAHPAPTVWQHAASWWPPSSFGVSWWPSPRVRRLRKSDASVPLPPPVAWTGLALEGLAVAGQDRFTDWAAEMISVPLGVQDVVRVVAPPLTARYWGSTDVLEATAYPRELEGLVSWTVEGRTTVRCQWCGERVVSPQCPYCGMDRAGALPAGRPR